MAAVTYKDIPSLISAYQNGENLGNSQNGLDVVTNTYGLAATILASTPFGLGANMSALGMQVANNISNYTNGTISPSNILGLTSASLSTLAAIGVVVAAPGAAVAVAIATGFAIATNLDVVEDAFNDLVDTLSDPEFWDLFEQHWDDFFSPLYEFVDDAQSLIDDLMSDVNEVFTDVNDFFNMARNWIQRSDPLTLDLDGDGLETTGIDPNNPILFDHDGDGTANATGWVKPDDGYLVFGRNENGLIDNGTELFGDSTPLLDENGEVVGQAADGFAALAAEDTNGDGIVDSNDANWDKLRVWQDLNSDGKTDEGELKTLEELGIAGFHVAKEENTQVLADGNAVADLGSYIRTDGSEGTLGEVTGHMADIDLIDNPFYREFSDTIPLTEQAKTLADMQGSGNVRDLREASSLSSSLANAVESYSAAETKAEQMALVDDLIEKWAASANNPTSIEQAEAQGYRLQYLVPGLTPSMLSTSLLASSGSSNGSGSIVYDPDAAQQQAELRAELLAEQARVTELVGLLEQFNGMTFVDIEPEGVRTGANTFVSVSSADTGSSGGGLGILAGPRPVYVPLSSAQITFLERAYESLRTSVYDGLLLQTRLKPYMNAIGLSFSEAGLAFDFSDTTAAFEARFDEAPAKAVRDLLDLQRMAGNNLTGMGWDGLGLLYGWLESDGDNPDVQAALAEFGYGNIETDGSGSSASEIVTGDAAGDDLSGGGGNDLVLGSEGDDTLNGGTGNDTLYGGAGNDTYRFNRGDGADTIIETHGDTGEDALEFGAGIRAGDLDISAEGDALVFSRYGSGDRIAIANWFGSLAEEKHRLDAVRFADGRELDLDALQVGSSGDDILEGTEANDILAGGGGNDTLYGHDGDDWLDGGSGADTLVGGAGNDTYMVDDAGDTVVEEADGGIDTVEARASATLSDNVENLTLLGEASTSGTGNDLDNVITGNGGNNTLDGGVGADILYSNSGDDTLHGGEGADTLDGGSGNDLLDGGAGADVMAGGQGDDTYVVDSLDDTVTEGVGEGSDTVQTHLDYTLGDNLENLTLTGGEAVSGTGNALDNTLTGNSADNTLQGLAGDDRLDGGAGADTLLGGSGNDTYVVESDGDVVQENAGEGTDAVESAITYTLTDHVENLILTGQSDIDGTGNELGNAIKGNSGANTLYGLEGDDWLDGGADADTLIGGTGNDTYVVDNAGDSVVELADEGIDTVRSSRTYTLGENLENLTLTGYSAIDGTGNELDNVITGNSGSNTLDGGVGADVMAGGRGNDTYILDDAGDSVVEAGGEGTDTVISPFDYTLGDNVENLTLTGEAITGTGNSLDNTLTGTDADNTLHGLDGNDALDGGAGADTLVGGRGNDTYVVDRAEDTVVEATGEGMDTVQSSVTWTLGDNLENLTLTGSEAIDGTGNELDNVIKGNSADNTLHGLEGNDTLDGGAGADTLVGGTGNDTYVVDNSGDTVVEADAEGVDTVKSSVGYTLTDNVENLTLTGYAAINGAGNNLDNVIKGNGGANVLEGLAGDDLLDGGSGADTLIGGEGDDTYFVNSSGDSVVENADEGYDRVFASASHAMGDNVEELTLTGSGNINGSGNALDNTLTGNDGDNRLDGGTGADTLTGGAGNDTYVVDDAGDVVTEAAYEGFDTVEASIDYTLGDYVENLNLTGDAALAGTGNSLNNVLRANDGDSTLYGMAGDDTLLGNGGNDLLDGGSGADAMAGGAGDDRYLVDDAGDAVSEAAGEGTDIVYASVSHTLSGNVENLTLTGEADINGTGNNLDNIILGNTGNNMLNGGSGNDWIEGGAGNDTLNGGTGADAMTGGTGDDTYIVDNTGDQVSELAGEGVDTVQASVSHTLSDNVENLTLTGSSSISGTGNSLNNVITGNNGSNTLRGLGGDDTLIGNNGNDTLDGGAGADTMSGGYGSDTYLVDDAGDVVTEGSVWGTDTVKASIDYTLTDNVERLTLTGTENLDGTGNSLGNIITGNTGNNVLDGKGGNDTINAGDGNDTLVGGDGNDSLNGQAGDDQLSGDAGNDTLNGGTGADLMAGGTGNDTYVVDNDGDVVTEQAGEGTDHVQSSITYTLTDNVENLTLTGSASINGTGNELNNVITGNNAANILDGLGGNDTLYGNNGNDTLLGGDGDDKLYGGAHNDVLDGGAGNDLLNGGTGADAMAGGTGDDTYIVDNTGDQVSELAGEGVDLVQSSVSFTLSDNVENLTLTGYSSISGTGNDLDNVITGNNGSNTLRGLGGDDTLVGNNGNDTLDGGAGADTMSGGYGNDTYVVDDAGDVVTEGVNRGTDTVQSSIDYTLTDNVENLTLTDTDDLTGTGNVLNNEITGNSGDNVLDGKAGNDTINAGDGNDTLPGGDGNDSLNGGAGSDQLFGDAGNDTLNGGSGADVMAGGTGNDTYMVDDAGDLVNELVGEGSDHVQSSITYTLTDNVENLTLTGTANIDGTGNELDNVINGNSGANILNGQAGDDVLNGNAGNDVLLGGEGSDTLNGGTGADIMVGGSGDDTYIVDNAGDQVTELAGEGVDTVQASVSHTLSDNVENLTLTGSSSISGTGNELDNVITGNSGSNTLRGMAGDDTLIGNNGNDTLDGGSGADTMSGGIGNDTYIVDDTGDVVSEGSGAGTDTVQTSIDYALANNVENLTLTGSDDLHGTGNTLNNVITGNSGNNVLDGGAGADTLAGGSGDDAYIVDNAGDTVIEQAGEGTDTVYASVSHTLDANVENLNLTGSDAINGAGNALDNWIVGNTGDNALSGGDGDDILDGGAGVDALYGGAGADTYVVDNVGDTVIESAGEGVDTVQAGVDFTLGDHIENLSLTGTDNLSGSGNALDNRLIGNDGDNVLAGGAGNDVLDGGKGDDLLMGGAGDEQYTFRPGEGTDTFRDTEGQDALHVGGNLSEFDLEADRVGNDMVVRVLGSVDSFVLADWFASTEGINTMIFDDGTVLDRDGIALLINRPPVANTDSITAHEDGGPVTFGADYLLANDTDRNPGDILSVISVGESGVGASVSLENGQITYDIGDAFQSLAEGEVVEDSFSYTITDDKGATDTGSVEATLIGANDLPVTTADTDSITEDQAIMAKGNVLANDHDIDASDILRIANPGEFAGEYGTLTLDEDGSYSYSLNNESPAVQALGRNAQAVERFDFLVTDGDAEVASSLDVDVNGTNDAPVVANALEDQDFTFHKPFSWQIPEGSFQDIDEGDVLDYTATLADGSELPRWLKFDPETQTVSSSFSGWTPKKVGYIDVQVTVTDRDGATGSTEGSLSTSDVFRLSVSHGNQGVGNGHDAPPAGHDHNFNDGPGTSPGNPGARRNKQHGRQDDRNHSQHDGENDTAGNFASKLKFASPDKLKSEQRHSQPHEEHAADANALLAHWEAIDRYMAAHGRDKGGSHEADGGAMVANSMSGMLGSHRRWGGHDPVALGGEENRMRKFKGLHEGMESLG